jgi:16S rRNA (uracil1498-N3)-methyltransferase
MRRLLWPSALLDLPHALPLGPAQAHRVTHVWRMRAGDPLLLADGQGRVVQGTLRWDAGEPWLESLTPVPVDAGAAEGPVTLVATLLKGPRWDWLLEKAAELGAHQVQPVWTERTVVRLKPPEIAERTARWQRICDAATEQCRGPWRTLVLPAVPLHAWLDTWRGGTMTRPAWGDPEPAAPPLPDDPAPPLLLWGDEENPLAPWPPLTADQPLWVLTGPEGGWSDTERRALQALPDAATAGLGPRTLRAETAALALLVSAGRARRA